MNKDQDFSYNLLYAKIRGLVTMKSTARMNVVAIAEPSLST